MLRLLVSSSRYAQEASVTTRVVTSWPSQRCEVLPPICSEAQLQKTKKAIELRRASWVIVVRNGGHRFSLLLITVAPRLFQYCRSSFSFVDSVRVRFWFLDPLLLNCWCRAEEHGLGKDQSNQSERRLAVLVRSGGPSAGADARRLAHPGDGEVGPLRTRQPRLV